VLDADEVISMTDVGADERDQIPDVVGPYSLRWRSGFQKGLRVRGQQLDARHAQRQLFFVLPGDVPLCDRGAFGRTAAAEAGLDSGVGWWRT